MKVCFRCKLEKENEEFFKRPSSKDGLQSYCVNCIRESSKINYNKNKEKRKLKSKKRWEKDKERIKKINKPYTLKFFKENPSYVKNWSKKKRKEDPNFKIKENIRKRLYDVLIRNKIPKTLSSTNLLDCSYENCRQYLESQFLPEFTWENYGIIWEIDHIIPCNSFDLTKLEEQKKCFHYTNLRPLFKTTEIAKKYGYNDIVGNRNRNK